MGTPGPRRPARPPGRRLGGRRRTSSRPTGVALRPVLGRARAWARRRRWWPWPSGRPGAGPARWPASCARPRPTATCARLPAGPRPRSPAAARPRSRSRAGPTARPTSGSRRVRRCVRLAARRRPPGPRAGGRAARRPGPGPVRGAGARAIVAGAERLAGRLARRGRWPWRRRWAGDGWAQAAAGWPVVVGARAAAWAPVPALAAAVVLDAHDEAYQEERTPTFNAAAGGGRAGGPGRGTVPAGLALPDRRPAGPGRPVGAPTGTSSAGAGRPSTWSTAGRPTPAPACTPRSWSGRCRGPWPGPAGPGRPYCVRAQPHRPGPAAGLRRPAASWPGASTAAGRSSRSPAEVGSGLRLAGDAGLRHAPSGRWCAPRAADPAQGAAARRDPGAARSSKPCSAGRSARCRDRPPRPGPERHRGRHRGRAAPGPPGRRGGLLGLRPAPAGRPVRGRARRRWPCWPGPAAWSADGGRQAGGVLVQTRLPDHPVLAAAVHGDPGRLARPELALRVRAGPAAGQRPGRWCRASTGPSWPRPWRPGPATRGGRPRRGTLAGAGARPPGAVRRPGRRRPTPGPVCGSRSTRSAV